MAIRINVADEGMSNWPAVGKRRKRHPSVTVL
jgi:hypothetical protein